MVNNSIILQPSHNNARSNANLFRKPANCRFADIVTHYKFIIKIFRDKHLRRKIISFLFFSFRSAGLPYMSLYNVRPPVPFFRLSALSDNIKNHRISCFYDIDNLFVCKLPTLVKLGQVPPVLQFIQIALNCPEHILNLKFIFYDFILIGHLYALSFSAPHWHHQHLFQSF